MIKFWCKFHIQIIWYRFTRDNRFLLTPSQSVPGKQEYPSSSVCKKFFQPPIQVCWGAYIPYFKINAPIFCCCIFFEECFNPQVRIDYHPSPSELTSRTHPVIFLWTPKGFISPEYFLNFFSNLYIAQWSRKSFKFMVLRLL